MYNNTCRFINRFLPILRMIVVDVETSGLDPNKHGILSIGAIDLFNPKNQFYAECALWKGAAIEQEALDVNGFKREKILVGSDPNEVIRNFLVWVETCTTKILAGQNPGFDLSMLQYAVQRAGIPWSLGHRTIDLHAVCYSHMLRHGTKPPEKDKKPELKSNNIMEYAGIPPEPKPHNALNGALWELKLSRE